MAIYHDTNLGLVIEDVPDVVSCDSTPTDTPMLISAIDTANGTPEPDTICLAEGGTYTFTAAYGCSNALPKITSEITIEGNNATLTRNDQ
jgi:hypothetical protein